MKTLRRPVLAALLALNAVAGSHAWLVAQESSATATPVLTREQMEEFLLKARIVATKGVDKGVTNTRRATLSDGRMTHDAQIQTVDIYRSVFTPARGQSEFNFKDTFRYNIAAYRLAVLLGLDNVPVSIARTVEGKDAAMTWWIDDVLMDESKRQNKAVPGWRATRTAGYTHVMRVFDELIANSDRNAGNMLWSTDGKLWLIDHTRAFRVTTNVRKPNLLERIDLRLFGGLRSLSLENVMAAVGDSLNRSEIRALLERRDVIVKFFEDKIAQRGERLVIYSLER